MIHVNSYSSRDGNFILCYNPLRFLRWWLPELAWMFYFPTFARVVVLVGVAFDWSHINYARHVHIGLNIKISVVSSFKNVRKRNHHVVCSCTTLF